MHLYQEGGANMAYRVHFTDDYGQGAFDVDTWKDAQEAKENLNKDTEHVSWDIWLEDLDNPEW